jgi:hypothetical protein
LAYSIEGFQKRSFVQAKGHSLFEVESTVFLSPNNDTVGESFELNIVAAQEAETLTGTAKPIILAQGSVRGKWNLGYSNTA